MLVVIGASLGIGRAMQLSGAADYVAQVWFGLAGADPWLTLIAIYVMTNLFTELVTNNAAAALLFPIAMNAH